MDGTWSGDRSSRYQTCDAGPTQGRMFGKSWREEWVVLYDDSTLAWYKEKGRGVPEGCIVVKDAPELLAVSQWTMRIPGRPDLPSGSQLVQLMAFGTRSRDKVHWLLAQSEEEVQ
ncbi:hypothetical protein WDU94_012537 [Cyamophila willieti]